MNEKEQGERTASAEATQARKAHPLPQRPCGWSPGWDCTGGRQACGGRGRPPIPPLPRAPLLVGQATPSGSRLPEPLGLLCEGQKVGTRTGAGEQDD